LSETHEIRVYHIGEDPRAAKLEREALSELDTEINLKTTDVYYVDGISEDQAHHLAESLLTNPVTQAYTVGPRDDWQNPHRLERTDREGIINPTVETITTSASRHGIQVGNMALGTEFNFDNSTPPEVVQQVAGGILVNREIHEVRTSPPKTSKPEIKPGPSEFIDIGSMSNDELLSFSREQGLGLSLEKMKAAQRESAKTNGFLPEGSLRLLGPYWSDHCRHETFNATIIVDGKPEKSLFGRIKDSAKQFYEHQEVIQAFDSNSAVFGPYTDSKGRKWAINIKGETHNHPTLIEAYGGVATGIGGLLRDIFATAKGAKPIGQVISMGIGFKNMTRDKIPKGLQTPKQILKRGVKAVSDYGNRVGVPTFDAAFHHHNGYRGKPMFLGVAIGIMPESATKEESPRPGDVIFALGGKTGQDGIGGATGSSAASNTETLASASEVQVPNAIEERKLMDAILECRDQGFIRAMTDCGAGGIGLAAGELGEDVGVEIDVSLFPLKAEDFAPSLKLISESQERAVMAVDPEYVSAVEAIFAKHDSNAAAIGTFGVGGDNPRYVVRSGDELVSDWSYDFLKNAIPTLELPANYKAPEIQERIVKIDTIENAFLRIMAHDDICSVEAMIRQFDHEVQGGNVLKPFTGVNMDCPNNASVVAPFLDENFGVVFSQSANPNLTDLDPVRGTDWVVDNLIARIVSVGGNPDLVKVNNNYITPRANEQVMGSIKLSVDRLLDRLAELNTAPFTGKDSCSSEHTDENGNIIKGPYNLSLAGFTPIPDVTKTVSADIKRTDSTLVLVGNMDWNSMGGSVLYEEYGGSSAKVPKTEFNNGALSYYQKVEAAIKSGKVLSCGVVGKGGIGASVTKMLFGGDCGANLDFEGVDAPIENILFNETAGCFIAEIPSGIDTEELFGGAPYHVIGQTTKEMELKVGSDATIDMDELKRAWKAPNEEIFA